MIAFTSAKSRLMIPGTVMMSEIPCTAWRRISSAMRNASKKLVPRSTVSIRRSFRLQHATFAFKRERLGDDSNAERAQLACERSHYGRGAAARASAEAGGDENHVRTFERLDNFFRVFKSSFAADLRVGTRAQSLRQLRTELQLHRRLRQLQRLQIRIRRDELDALDFGPNHAINGIAAATAHTDNLDLRRLKFLAEAHPDSCFFVHAPLVLSTVAARRSDGFT